MISLTFCLLMMTDLMPVQVSTMPFQQFVKKTETDFLASLEPFAAVDLHVRVDGAVAVERNPMGTRFSAGQEILAVDDREQQARLRLAQAVLALHDAELRNAERSHTRAQNNFDKGIIAQAELDSAALAVEKARAEVGRARASVDLDQFFLDNHHLVAPFDGVLAEATPEKGRFVTVNQKVGRLLDISRHRISFQVPANQRSLITAPGARFQLLEQPDAVLSLHAIAPAVEAETGMIAVELLAVGIGESLTPGSNIRVRRQSSAMQVHLPATSLREDSAGFYVFWVNDQARLTRLNLSSLDAVINLGVEWKNRRLVVLGPDGLHDGDPVNAFAMEAGR